MKSLTIKLSEKSFRSVMVVVETAIDKLTSSYSVLEQSVLSV